MVFSKYLINKGNIQAETVFIPTSTLPDIYISTPFTFPIFKKKYVLAKDKMGWWNPLGGHIDNNETWKQALTREAHEEAGVEIGNIKVFGYIKITKLFDHPDNKYPDLTQIPMTVSEVLNFDEAWSVMETSERIVADQKTVQELLKERTDNNQMLQVFKYLLKKLSS